MTRGTGPRRRAARRAAHWQEAFDLFADADAAGLLGLADLPVFGNAAYGAGHLDTTIEVWERAYAGLRAAGELVPAAGAAVRVAMHLLFDTALMAPVRGWLARAEQLLDDGGDTPAHAWARGRPQLRADADRRPGAGVGVRPAGQRDRLHLRPGGGGHRTGRGSVGSSSSTATSTRVSRCSTRPGWRRSRGTSMPCRPVSSTASSCARSKASPSTTWPRSGPRRWSGGHGRTPSAASTDAAGSTAPRSCGCEGSAATRSTQALLACDELQPYLRRELGWPLTELGRIRLRLGDVAGAEEALMAAHHAGWDPQPGLALVRLAQGDVETAAALDPRSARQPIARPVEGAPAEHRAPAGAAARRAGRDRGRGRRRRSGRVRGGRARGHRHPLPEQGAPRRCGRDEGPGAPRRR